MSNETESTGAVVPKADDQVTIMGIDDRDEENSDSPEMNRLGEKEGVILIVFPLILFIIQRLLCANCLWKKGTRCWERQTVKFLASRMGAFLADIPKPLLTTHVAIKRARSTWIISRKTKMKEKVKITDYANKRKGKIGRNTQKSYPR